MGKGIITCKHTAAVTLQHKAFIRTNDVLKIKLVDVQSFFGRINAVYQRRVNTLEHFIRLFEYIHIDYLIIDVVFAQQTDGTRLHAQIHVFRDKNGFHFRLFGRKPVHYRQNLMVGNAFGKGITYPGRVHHACHHKQTAQALSQWRPFGEQIIIGNQIKLTDELTRIEINLLITFLEFVQFFKDYDGKINVILLKILQTIIIVKNHIRINHKIFLSSHTR